MNAEGQVRCDLSTLVSLCRRVQHLGKAKASFAGGCCSALVLAIVLVVVLYLLEPLLLVLLENSAALLFVFWWWWFGYCRSFVAVLQSAIAKGLAGVSHKRGEEWEWEQE